jgi:hypothetical protein
LASSRGPTAGIGGRRGHYVIKLGMLHLWRLGVA